MQEASSKLLDSARPALGCKSRTEQVARRAALLEERARTLLGSPRAMAAIGVLSVIGLGTTFFSGLAADDHIHRLSLSGSNAIEGFQRPALDLFRFASPAVNHKLMDQGVFPWWADPEARLAFFRPVTSLTHALDHALWPDSGFMMHVHGACWFLLGLFGLAVLYRKLVQPRWVAALAFFFYALDDARAGPVAWIANRNALIACAFSVWALVFHQRARAEGWRPGIVLGPLALALGLVSSEGAIATLGYLLAYAVFLDTGSWRRRVLGLLPHLVVIFAWRIASRALDYGSFGSGVYLDPLLEPLPFARALAERLPVLLLAQLAGPWSELSNVSVMVFPALGWLLLGLASLVLLSAALLLRPLWRKDPSLRFWVVGAVLSAVPACATFPADRLLSWLAIGGAPAVALVFSALLDARRNPSTSAWSPRFVGGALAAIVLLHVVIGPLTMPWRGMGAAALREMLARAEKSVPSSAEISSKTFVYVNPPADPLASYIPIIRADVGKPLPGAQRWLATGTSEVVLQRIDARTLRVRQTGGYLLAPSETIFRSPRRPLKVGERVQLGGFSAEVTSLMPDGRPAEALVRFSGPLEDGSLRWFRWAEAGYEPFRLPAIGERVRLPKADFFKVAYGAD